jgi:hypothetical protein
MTKHTARDEAQRYVAKLVETQGALGYKRPAAGVVKSAVKDAADAVRMLSSLSEPKP